jgi:hypothetical protein
MVKITRLLLAIFFIALLAAFSLLVPVHSPVHAQEEENPYLIRTIITKDGREIDEVIFPGKPPETKAEPVDVPEPYTYGAITTNSLFQVPAFDWSYGCSATSAAMLFGYYDNDGYHTNMYAGGTNAGVCVMDNSVWGDTVYPSVTCHECPLSATHNGVDGRAIYGHVDDYWVDYGDPGPDPFDGNWTEHTLGDCTGDYMGTNQAYWQSSDGSTTFYNYSNGAPLYDFTDCETDPSFPGYPKRDGGHGLKLFVDSRGYSVYHDGANYQNYNQYIDALGLTYGFTFDQYMAEIDAGRPVLIHVTGHTMLGFGYYHDSDLGTETVYLHDTWDHLNHEMTWGGSYSGLLHRGVTVLRLETVTDPTWESYNSSGSVDDYFEEYPGENEANMYGTGFSGSYKVVYWDTDGDKARAEIVSDVGGALTISHTFNESQDPAGDWHVAVYSPSSYNPSSYSATDPNIIADDTSYTGGYAFHVEETAIPEFPTAMVAFAMLAICAGTYFWLRRKAASAPA